MSRYDSTNMIKVNKQKRSGEKPKTFMKYETTILNKVPEGDGDIHVISQNGDRLDNLAFQFYGNAGLWWFIAQTNNINTMNIPTGTSLRISFNTQFASGT